MDRVKGETYVATTKMWSEVRNDPKYINARRKQVGLPPLKENKSMTTNQYRVLKNSRVATKTMFPSYERARQWIRKQLRKSVNDIDRHFAGWDCISRNPPSISDFGYKIKRVSTRAAA